MSQTNPVPHLTTANNGPLHQLEKLFLDKQVAIESWFRQQWRATPPPITSSVDLRNAGFKLAPVDTNLFPAGFNNLNRDFIPLCIQAAQSVVSDLMPSCTKIMLVPESHTRNPFYLHSLATLQEIFSKAGFEIRIGSLLEDLNSPRHLELPDGKTLVLESIQRAGNQLLLNNFKPCMILLNNDLSDGIPQLLSDVTLPIHPSPQLGWSARLKSQHFMHYQQVCEVFASLFEIDPWLISPIFSKCNDVDFMQGEGIECLADSVASLLQKITNKYQQYGVTDKPFVVVKADTGTYGMGVMMVHDAQQLTQLNRKQRTNMSATKGSQKLTKVIIQEGVYTFETWNNAVAEPVVYMIGQYVVGGFYRVHKVKGIDENLNAPGMYFEPLAFASVCNNPDKSLSPNECPNRFYSYGVIARLAGLAAAREFAAITTNKSSEQLASLEVAGDN